MSTAWANFDTVRRKRWQRTVGRAISLTLLVWVAALLVLPSPAQAWWNDDWKLRKKITFDTSAAGAAIADAIGSTPVLIRLHSGNFRFAQAKDDGSDLRFVAGDDKLPLKHHVEKYDALLGEALVWVSVPNMQPGAKTEIWLYYGNAKAVAVNDPKGTYDPETLLVYHFNERTAPALDSSVWGNNAQTATVPADGGLIGNGARLDGRTPIAIPATSSLAIAADAPLTWSSWVKPAELSANAVLYSRRDTAAQNGLIIGLDNGTPFVEAIAAGVSKRSAATAKVAPSSWHHLAVTAANGQVTLYLDGNVVDTLAGAVPSLNTPASVGADGALASPAAAAPSAASPASPPAGSAPADGATPSDAAAVPASIYAGFVGDIDELEIAKVARPAGYIKASAIGQGTSPSKFVSFSMDEETASWLSGYFAVILKSVTLDGWVVIGILMIMAAISWVVMYDRTAYLNRQSRANAAFIRCFHATATNPIALSHAMKPHAEADRAHPAIAAEDKRLLPASALYRIYHLGAEEIDRRFAENGRRQAVLADSSIAAIRSALDSVFVKETQRLNRLMVILTIAISGGPFLGLLGTVVGVMITFAAIAASGDVNVNAIAPGIAAALVATVAGLGVAIPALFGYNYLISRIKNLTSDMQVFVDEFIGRVTEAYSGDRGQPGPSRSRYAAE